jgi:acetyl-CoA hydrolase
MATHNGFTVIAAEEAAATIPNGATIGFSGFTPAGAAKAIPKALATRANAEHAAGRPYAVRVFTGASTGPDFDEAMAKAGAISFRAPYQSSGTLRKLINSQQVEFVDMHLSHVAQTVLEGFYGEIDVAVVEATEVTRDGRIYLSTSVGASPTYLAQAKRIFVEINARHSQRLSEIHDIATLPVPPKRAPIPINDAMSRIGVPFVAVDPAHIVGVVLTNAPDGVGAFDEAAPEHQAIAQHVVRFLLEELKAGRIPREFLPLQSGVGNVANAVMAGLGEAKDIPPFYMYSEVFQDALLDLMRSGKLLGASATSLTLTDPLLQQVYDDFAFFAKRLVLRPQELSNHPGVVRRLGVIAMNTGLEVDIYGNVNSTHVCGTQMMNGIGGSGDFTRNAFLSIFMCPSTAKGGKISAIVPMASHLDHNEHSVTVVVTEQGLADLRGLGPMQRARTIIDRCAHPAYRPYLHDYLEKSPGGHIRHDLKRAFELHCRFLESGSMLP